MKNNMEMSLKNREWKEFILSDLFDFEKGSNKSLSSETSKKGIIDYVGATSRNNGSVGFVSKNHSQYLKKGNCVVFINTGEGSVGEAIYKKNSFIPSNNVTIGRSNFLNEYIGHFIVSIINNQSHKYSYGYIRNEKRLKRDKILLPINAQGKPDYEFMEAYMRVKEQEKTKAYKNYISKRIKELETAKPVVSLKEKDWAEFEIQKLFDTKIGKNVDGNKVNKETGKTAYITRKESFNGLDGFINFNEEYLTEENPVITIGNETAEPFVQNYPFFTGTKVNILLPKNELNRFSLMFVATSLRMHKSKYSYSFTINSTRLKKQKILLPINEKNEPDYDFMENYIKRLELEKIKKYLDYKELK